MDLTECSTELYVYMGMGIYIFIFYTRKMCNERETEDETKLSCEKPLRSATQS